MSGSHFRFILGLVSLSVYSSADSIQTLSSAGAAAAESPVEVAAECDRIVTMLPNSPHVRSVYSQLLSKAAPGTLFLDCSTIDPAVAKEVFVLN